MGKIMGFCGLDCAECPAYIATQSGDRGAQERVAAQWRTQFNKPEITADSILCDGCAGNGRISGYCSTCEMRACGMKRGIPNCAYCPDYVCSKLETFHKAVPYAKANLDTVNASL
jgi:hypothetical protein